MHVFLHVEITPGIDLDPMKYKSSLIFGSPYMILLYIGIASFAEPIYSNICIAPFIQMNVHIHIDTISLELTFIILR